MKARRLGDVFEDVGGRHRTNATRVEKEDTFFLH